MRFSQEAINIVKEFEGFKAKPYVCPAGKLTIGYGHALLLPLKPDCRISETEGSIMLKNDLLLCSSFLNQKVKISLPQGKHDALCSLIYNWGVFNFGKSRGLSFLNASKFDIAAIEFFSKEKGVVRIKGTFCEGLYRRRQAELKLWNKE